MKDILTDLDKFKRKIVHKIAERFGVIRDVKIHESYKAIIIISM